MIKNFDQFLNENESFRNYEWTFGRDDIEEYEGALECAREVEKFLGKGLEILLADWDRDYDEEMGEVDPLGETILEAFDSAKANFRQVKELSWEGEDNFYSTFTLYQHKTQDLRVVVEKGDRGWEWSAHNDDLFTNVLISGEDYQLFNDMEGMREGFVKGYFLADDGAEFLKANKVQTRRAAKRLGLL
jgi:hypothetical protein